VTAVAEVVARHQEAILRRWADEASTLAGARGITASELRNRVADYLVALSALRGADAERRRHLTSHLSARLRSGYMLCDALEELAILGRCVTEAAAQAGADALDPAEMNRLHAALRDDAGVVIDAFTQYAVTDSQAEKHYLRRLQTLAHAALPAGPGEADLVRHLRDVLELVMEAVEAQCAAIFFHNFADKTLWLAASAGIVEEPLKHYVADEATASFVAAIAARKGDTMTVLDAETTEFALSDELRTSGIHALLGVRLPARQALMGVMYVGMTERRPFTLRQVQRLESLGAQLSINLDLARLHATLKLKVDDLNVEQVLRERFISVLAHDLRNPLLVIRTAAHILNLDADALGDHRALPRRVLSNVVRADAMIRDLLDALRIRAGHELPLTLAECELAAVARAACDELTSVFGDRFVLRGDAPVRGVWSAEALHRALWNLATNAVKHGAPDAPIEVTVRGTAAGAAISVHNQGPAIDEADRATLFEPFVQVGAASGSRRGWGLGLTLVQSCAQAHGGSVAVASTPADGTTFTLEIPWDSRPFQSGA
jgi:signal transduction histidine kinase